MKKALGFFLSTVVVAAAFFATPRSPLACFNGAEAEVYYTYAVKTSYSTVELGQGCLVRCFVTDVQELPQDYFAVSVTTTRSEWQKAKKILRVRELATEEGEDFFDSLCYSPAVKGGVRVDGMTINMQVALMGDGVKIGFPFIVGSF